MMRYLTTITYDGENYCGWQKQPNGLTIQEEIEKALKTLLKSDVPIFASGRTDAKVNALGQVAHFETDIDIEKSFADNNKTNGFLKFLTSINAILPNDIKIIRIIKSDIHARFSAKKKTYLYQMYKSDFELPLKIKSLRVSKTIAIKAIKNYAKTLIGTHDFKNFCASHSNVDSTIRTIYSIKVKQCGENIDFFITGNGFLYKMVRNIVGLILFACDKNMNVKEFKQIAFTSSNIKKTAPPNALFLLYVKY